MAATVRPCSCQHEYQDQKYGKGLRVKNTTEKKSGERFVTRCTVCKKED